MTAGFDHQAWCGMRGDKRDSCPELGCQSKATPTVLGDVAVVVGEGDLPDVALWFDTFHVLTPHEAIRLGHALTKQGLRGLNTPRATQTEVAA